MTSIKLAAFDLDDTLYPERDFVKSGFAAVATHLDLKGIVEAEKFFRNAWRLFEEGVRGTIFNQTLSLLKINFHNEQIREMVIIYREHKPVIKPFDSCVKLLEILKGRHIVTVLISDGPEKTQNNKLQALGLADYFEHIIFTGAYGADWGKPSTRPFLEAMRRGQVTGPECVYIADNPAKDFLGPNQVGWRTIRVRGENGLYYNENPPQGGEPQETIESLDHLLVFLKGRNEK